MSSICIGSEDARFLLAQPCSQTIPFSTVTLAKTGREPMLVRTVKPHENYIRVQECSRGHIIGSQTIKLGNIRTALQDHPGWFSLDASQVALGGQQIIDLDLNTPSLVWLAAPIVFAFGFKRLFCRSLTPSETLAMMACRSVAHNGFCLEDEARHWFNNSCQAKGVEAVDRVAFSMIVTTLANLGCLRLLGGRIYPTEELSRVPFDRRP